MDLHGLHVKDAIEILEERIQELRKKREKQTLCVITGAGIHSDEKGPKIKPAVKEYLQTHSIKFEENDGNGSLTVHY